MCQNFFGLKVSKGTLHIKKHLLRQSLAFCRLVLWSQHDNKVEINLTHQHLLRTLANFKKIHFYICTFSIWDLTHDAKVDYQWLALTDRVITMETGMPTWDTGALLQYNGLRSLEDVPMKHCLWWFGRIKCSQ